VTDQTLALYEKLAATVAGIEVKGDTVPYTSLNGHMTSNLTHEGRLALRLPEPQRTEFLNKYKTKLVEQYGIVRKEYVEVPDALLARTQELSQHFQVSIEYVRGMKPKATTKKKTGAKKAPAKKSKARRTRS
jgi:hypothetical protein